MATESPMRMVESGGARTWPSSTDATMFGSPLKSIGAEELGFLFKGHRFRGGPTDVIPSRSGSAPPSMEGSFAAIGNILAKQNCSMNSSLESLSSVIENCESEEQLRSDPAYFAYYCTNVNLNPRLPMPLMSSENRRLVHHIGGLGNNWRSDSLDNSGTKCFQLSRGSLSTHEEEPEEYRSPREFSESDNSMAVMFGQSTTSLTGRHKSLVDLIQEDFPRTPSPVYSQSHSSSYAAEEAIDNNVRAISSNVSSINLSKAPESNSVSDVETYTQGAHMIGLVSSEDPSTTTYPSLPCLDGTTRQKDEPSIKNTHIDIDDSIKVASSQPGLTKIQPRMSNKQEERQSYGRNVQQQHPSTRQGIRPQAQVISQGMNQSHGGMERFSHGHPKFSSIEVQPSPLSSAPNPALYASAGAYMTAGTPFYLNFQPAGLYSPQYSVGGYAMGSPFLSPLISGYHPSRGTITMPFSSSSIPSFDGSAGALSGDNMSHVSGMQPLGRFYGQQGLMLQPSFVDPAHMQYFQNPFGDPCSRPVQQNQLASTSSNGSQVNSFVPQKEPTMATYIGEQKFLPPTNGSLSFPCPGKVGMSGAGYYGSPLSMGIMTRFPASPLTSPVLPSSPVGGMNHLGRRNDMRFFQGSSRNTGQDSGNLGQKVVNTSDDHKRHYFLEELKSSNCRKFELSDITGRIVEFSVDQHGSRFIQQKLEHCSVEEKSSVFREVLPHASKLMTDVFGNYVIQKFFEHGSTEQRKELAEKLAGQMLQLSLQMYGCRVIQKALEVIELDQKTHLVLELDGHVFRCVHDQNGNHVIQKCIECVPMKNIEFIISAFQGQVAMLSTHPYGCRVIQRVLEHCSNELQSQCIVDEILESAYLLAQDQYGNYVTQHVLERGKPHERSQIISKLTGKIVQMSQHKYASNVVEKCLEHADPAERELLISEIVGQSEENDNLLTMMKDQFANYVVQKILEISNDKQEKLLLDRIRVHADALRKYTYGKHIVARFEQLFGEEESQASEP